MQIVILGNGIMALTVAYRLLAKLESTDRMTIIGKKSRPGSATLAAAAMLNSFAELETHSLDSTVDRYRFELSRQSTASWPQFAREIMLAGEGLDGDVAPSLCNDCSGCSKSGTYLIETPYAGGFDEENFTAALSAAQEMGEPFEWADPNHIPNYHPEEKYRASRALYLPNEGWINPRLIMDMLDQLLVRSGRVEFVDDEAASLVQLGDSIDCVHTCAGRVISGDQFVVATGATIGKLFEESQLGLPIQKVFYGLGVSLEIKSPGFPHTHCVRTPNRGKICGIYTAPYFTGENVNQDHILIGASNRISHVPQFNGQLSSVESLMRGAREQINVNFGGAELVRVNVGWRPVSLDTYPLMGKTSIPNLIVASGTRRDGFHLSPVLSGMIRDIVLGIPVDERFSLFSPERKPIRSLTRYHAVQLAVKQRLGVMLEHKNETFTLDESSSAAHGIRQEVERIHDKAGAMDWGIPPEMLEMYDLGYAMA